MNYHQLKQYLFNNLLFGENGVRKRGKDNTLVLGLMIPDASRVFGIDLSHWNKPSVDIKRMKDLYGLKFAIIKGCDGSVNSNYYPEHRAGAKAAGIPWGMYVWLYPGNRVNIDAQINTWWARYSQDVPPMGLFIDAEWTTYGGVAANPSANDLRAAHNKWFAKSGKHAITYTAKGYADQYLIGFDWSREPLWVAHYGVNSPALPSGASQYKYWQFTSTLDGHALDPNGNAELDGNYYNGTPAQFAAEFGTVSEPEPPTGDEPMTKYTLKNTGTTSLTIRGGASVLFGSVGSIAPGVTVEGDFLEVYNVSLAVGGVTYGNKDDKWLHITTPEGWAAVIHKGQSYGQLTTIPSVPASESVWSVEEKNGLLFDVAEIKTDANNISAALLMQAQTLSTIVSGLSTVNGKLDELLTTNPTTPPTASDGYAGPRMGIYEVIDVPSDPINQQWTNGAVPLFDDNGGDRLQIKEQLYDLWMNTLEGFKELVDSGTVVTDDKGLRFILGKAVKGQKLLIALQGKSEGVMKGQIVGFSNEDNPLVGAVNFASCTPDTTPWLFHKVKNVRRFIPIMTGNKGNNWWIPMSWLKKVS